MPGLDRSRFVGISDNDLDEFTCLICQSIFDDPMVTQCCRQTYCKTCIYEWLNTSNTCPNDRKSLNTSELTQPPRFAINFLNNMKIKCENEENGCPVVTTVANLDKHLEECDHKPDVCKICGPTLKRPHNCFEELVIKNKNFEKEIARLNKENQELKNKSINNTMSMSNVLELARNAINSFEIMESNKINHAQQQFLIGECQKVIQNHQNSPNICLYLFNTINESKLFKGSKRWNVICFAPNGGQSWINKDQCFKIKFDRLLIILYTSQ